MRLTLDLRLAGGADPVEPDERRLTLLDLGSLVKGPAPARSVARLVLGQRYVTVAVIEDSLPLSGPQAGIRALAALARSESFERLRAGRVLRMSPARFRVGAAVGLVAAMLREVVRGAALAHRAQRIAGRPFELAPRALPRPRSVAYLRPEPTLSARGARVGGAATHTSGVINGFAANGLDVQVFAPESPADIEGVSFTLVPLRRVYHLAHWLTAVDYSEEYARLTPSGPLDFVYQRHALGSYAGLELARRLGVPLVLEFNGSEIWAERHWGLGGIPLVGRLRALEERNLRDASLVVVVSAVLGEQLAELGVPPERVLVNPNGVDLERLAPFRAHSPAEWRSSTAQPQAPTIGFVGTFGLWHGVRLLAELVQAVRAERPDARFVLIGDGPLYEEVRRDVDARGVAAHVSMPGSVPHERALALLAGCDVCISPHVPNPDGSRFFGSPTKLFEYMGLGKPIVASRLEQIGEVIEHERSGLLCPPGDVPAAAAALLSLLGNPALRARLAAGALERAETDFSWRAHTRRILDALSERSAPE